MSIYVQKTGEKFLAADRVWIAVALLHRENPHKKGFSLKEIQDRARKEGFLEDSSNTFYVHANQHCVANRAPNPGNHRMLTEIEDGKRRLYKTGDPCKPRRTGKITPDPNAIPAKYRSLLDWYNNWNKKPLSSMTIDPLLRLIGSGKDIWKDEHADEYVDRLREGWE